MPALHAFPRSHRLSSRPAFDAVFAARVKCSRGPLTGFALPNGLSHWRLGLSVPRRVGTAPRRNRIKRLMREAFRMHQHQIPVGHDLVVVVRPHEPLPLAQYHQIMADLLARLYAAWAKRSQ